MLTSLRADQLIGAVDTLDSLPTMKPIVDLDNKSGEQPGYYFDVFEKFGGIEITLYPTNTPEGEKKKYGVFLNLEEAGDFHSALKKAIDHANSMKVYGSLHKSRIRTPT